jgi:hypothetical protein
VSSVSSQASSQRSTIPCRCIDPGAEEERTKTENESLEQSLSLGETKIQQEYDLHFARLGQRFAVGDCKFE